MAEPISPQEPISTTPAAPSPQQLLADQYDIESTAAVPPPAATPAQASVPSSAPAENNRPRDPETGRFLSDAPAKPSEALLEMAKSYGVSQDAIDRLPVEALEIVVRDQHRAHKAMLEQHNITQTLHQNLDRKPPQPQLATNPVAGEEVDLGTDESGQKLLPEHFAGNLGHLVSSLVKQVKQLQAQVNALMGRAVAQENLTARQKIDKFFNTYPQIYGKGEYEELDAKSEEMELRNLVAEKAFKDKSNLSIEAKLAKAHKLIYRTEAGPTAVAGPKPPSISPEEWAAAGLARPTHREDSEPLGERRATRELAKMIKEMEAAPETANGLATIKDFPD